MSSGSQESGLDNMAPTHHHDELLRVRGAVLGDVARRALGLELRAMVSAAASRVAVAYEAESAGRRRCFRVVLVPMTQQEAGT